MRWKYPRTWIAVAVTSAAVLVPCTAWWFAGNRALERDVEEILSAPYESATSDAVQLSRELAARLAALEREESRRPYHDYLPQEVRDSPDCILDPAAALFVAPDTTDPLIWAHFQIDDVGRLSLPDFTATQSPDTRRVFDEMECAATVKLASLPRRSHEAEERFVATSGGVVRIGPFAWHAAQVTGQDALVAIREVRTRPAEWTQGFVVLRESLNTWLADRRAGAGISIAVEDRGRIPLAVGEVDWGVRIHPGDAAAAAETRAERRRRMFHLAFLGGVIAACAAAAGICALVWQSERLADRRTHFAAAAAHELRTPLAGMQLHAEMLADGTGREENRPRYARRIADDAARLGRVVTNVLGYSRLQRGGVPVQLQKGDLGTAVADTIQRLRPALEANGARLDLELPDESIEASFDRDALDGILVNLVDNAERYSRDAEDRTIHVRVAQADGAGRIDVIDHGKGVDPSVRSKLFQPFSRGSDANAPAGLGLGLALVKALAEAQRATVRHDELDGGRTCFTVAWAT